MRHRFWAIALGLSLVGSLSLISLVSALTYPAGAPAGEIVGGTYRTYFDNMFPGCPVYGDVIRGFTSTGAPICITPSATGLNMTGALGYTIYHNGTTWTGSANLYNGGGNIGIGMTPSASSGKLQVNGQIMITGGTPGLGKFLVSDAGGLASWQTTSAILSGTYWSLSGNTIGTNDFLGSINAQDLVMMTNNTEKLRILSTTSSTGALLFLSGGDAVINGVTVGRGSGAVGFNTALGVLTLASITTGNANTAVGHNGLNSLTSGSQNTSVGGGVLTQVTNGSYNTAIGYTSQNQNLTASYNTSIGSRSLNANQVGLNNSVFGYRAGNILTSSNNILLGYQAGDVLTTGANNIVLGYDIDTPTPTSSNTLNIGNLIFGTSIDGTNTTLSTGNIGIGTSSPSARLTVSGSLQITDGTQGAGKFLVSDASGIGTWQSTSAALSGTYWSLSGNTVGVNDFIGSNNANDLVLKTNGVERLRFNTNGNITGVGAYTGTFTNSIFLGNGAGFQTTGANQTGIGGLSPGYQMLGNYNAAFGGAFAGWFMNGFENVAIGGGWPGFLMSGTLNTAIGGYEVGVMMKGNQNLALGGYFAGWNMNGQQNTALGGYAVGVSSSGTYNSFVGGYSAGIGTNGYYNTTLGGSGAGVSMSGFNNTAIGGYAVGNGVFGNYNTTLGGRDTGYDNFLGSMAGDYNTALGGYRAGGFTNGTYQTVVGGERGGYGMTGSYNLALGGSYGGERMSGLDNVALGGNSAGYYMQGYANIAIGGYRAGYNMAGQQNVAIGTYAGQNMTTGDDNLYLGSYAVGNPNQNYQFSIGNVIYGSGMGLNGATNGRVGIGTMTPGAKLTISGGTIQIIDGTQGAGKILTSDASGVASWVAAVASSNSWLVTGNGGTSPGTNFVGTTDAQDLVVKTNGMEKARILSTMNASGQIATFTGGDIVVNGVTVGRGSSGSDNTVTSMGYHSLQNNSLSQYNSAFGFNTLPANTNGVENAAFGGNALISNIDGSENTALGIGSMFDNVSGNYNTAVGYLAGYKNTGSKNTSLGFYALSKNISGTDNVALGYHAAGNYSGASGAISRNTIIGSMAGYSMQATSNDNTLIGYRAGNNLSTGVRNTLIGSIPLIKSSIVTTGNYNISIGWDTQVLSGTLSDQLNIGNWIYGSGGNIGIGATVPGQKLTVSGGTIQIIDGTQGAGKFLVSDASGIASWQSTTATLSGTYWSLSGNTVGVNDYIGSNNARDLALKTNNTEKMRILSSTSSTGALLFVNGGDAVINGVTVGMGSGQVTSNTAFGSGALSSNTSGFWNTANGYGTLSSNTSGRVNTANGYQALSSNTTGQSNTANGAQSLSFNTSGNFNTANGYRALFSNITGSYNVANGLSALYSNTTGWSNTANGYVALYSNTTGNNNTANGYGALFSNTGGNANTANGYVALYSNTIGDYNTANGYQALYSNTTGGYNTVNGLGSLFSNTTGYNNTANGYSALAYNTVGSGNVALGTEAIYTATGVDFQTAVGYQALRNSTTGTQNLGIGYRAGSGITTGSSNIAIGYDAQVPSGTASNQLNIGNWIYGSAGNIGIGTSSSLTSTLTVSGSALITSDLTVQGKVISDTFVNRTVNNVTISGSLLPDLAAPLTYRDIGNNTTQSWNNLYLSGQVTIKGGTPGANKVLTSDALGLATWQVVPTSVNNWSTTGNAGTTAGTNYLGTTDGQDLVMKTNAIEKMRILSATSSTGALFFMNGGDAVINGITVGMGSGQSSTNTVVGNFALQYNTTGFINTAIGALALQGNLTGNFNTAIGSNALRYNTSGSSNTANGVSALQQNTLGSSNTANGVSALLQNTTGNFNTANGSNALYQNIVGSGNVALGTEALYTATGLSFQTAVGYQALRNSTTGTANAAFGYQALYSNISGTNNTANGYQALSSNTTGTSNMANGAYALRYNSTGVYNIANGAFALNNNTTGNNNVGIGYVALYQNSMSGITTPIIWTPVLAPSYNNTAIGGFALSNNILGAGNTSIGAYSYQVATGSYNTLIGYKADLGSSSNFTNATAIGANAIVAASNALVLGSGANVGIGTSAPSTTLHVVGSVRYDLGSDAVGDMYYRGGGVTSPLTRIPIGSAGQVLLTNTSGTAPTWTTFSQSYLSGAAWTLSGNTIGSNDFFGSINAQPLVMMTNNIEKLRILSTTSSTGALLFLSGGDAVINGLTIGRGSGAVGFNTAIGMLTLGSITTGNANTAIGHNGLNSLTSGSQNTSVGGGVLTQITTGVANTAVGYTSQNNNLTASYNTSYGARSLNQNQIGLGNVAMGYEALYTATGVDYQTAIGYQALKFSTTGIQNLAIGYQAGSSITTGSNNIAIGYNAQVSLGTASNQLNIGNWIYGNNGNIAIGASGATASSIFEIWSGSVNYLNFRGTNNIGMGAGALRIGMTGNADTAFGNEALYTMTTGYSNSAFGHQALRQSTSGFNNSAFGKEAMYNDNDGTWNTAIGYQALRVATSSDYNVAIGGQSLYNLGTGSGNTAIGHNALYAATSTTSNNTVLGYMAGSGITSGWGNIALGYGAQVPSNTASNQLNIGNWIYGSGGNIGIGTGSSAALTARFNIDGGANGISGLRMNRLSNTSTTYTGASVGLGIDAAGNVVPISNGDVVVYTAGNPSSPPTPDPDIANRAISYDYNKYFDIPTTQSFVVSDGSSASYNGPFFRENGTTGVCSWNGTYGSSPYACSGTDTYGVSASPANSFTMTAKGSTFGYQLALGARGDAPLFARSGRFNGAVGGGLYTNDSPYQTPAPWQRVLTVPANHNEYFYINTGFNSQLQAISGGGMIGLGTTKPSSMLTLSGSTFPTITALTTTGSYLGLGSYASTNLLFDNDSVQAKSDATTAGPFYMNPYGGNVNIGGSSAPSSTLEVNGTVKLGTNGTQLNAIIKASPTVDIASIAAGACTAQTFTVTNAVVGGVSTVSPASALTDRLVIAYARVSAANTVEAKFCNESASAIDPPSMVYYISVIQ